ncbi:MAG: TonB-dependent receptor [Phenylobacterium sp.]|uniref:TonB-dependent receptor n=1 Tax=Phenylobacterium sp. TaxID=1871053 RepID=UPI0027335C6F|nr:TonB-dependent receptor [Phenylobacterium sp.]MDP3750021.1 TonB-dependent receptor [Phenylobacterium sp.]
MKVRHSTLLASASALSLLAISAPAYALDAAVAAEADSTGAVEEIIVTARKRAESDIAVPAVITTYTPEKLERAGANDMYALARMTPQLIISNNAGTTGGSISMRGVGSGTLNGVDQTVAINLDGIAVSNAAAARIGYFDLKQVEILKGPQALFFGKNSTGGIISFRSEDPSSTLSGYLRAAYEFNADEVRLEGAVGGPVTDWLKVRVAGYVGTMQGYFKNPLRADNPDPLVFGPSYDRAPNRDEFGYRVTLLAQPNDKLDANLKITFVHSEGTPSFAEAQLGFCPLGASQANPAIFGVYAGDCKIDKYVQPLGDASPTAVAGLAPRLEDGEIYETNQQFVATLNLDYRLTDDLTLTSVTGVYDYLMRGFTVQIGPRGDVLLVTDMESRDASQEVRLTSDYGGRFDFMVGGYFQRSVFHVDSQRWVQGPVNAANYKVPNYAYSVFGQGIFRVRDNLELAAGARWTDQHKRVTETLRFTGDITHFIPVTEISVEDISPEVTLTWRPTSDLTLFGAYKEGFKSGGFNASVVAAPAGVRIDYGPEYAHGFEGGLKARLFDRSMRLDVSIYRYDYDDLQVSAFDAVLQRIFVQNAASATVQGVDFSVLFQPRAVPGLTLESSVGYNKARFGTFQGACYTGQTIAAGCNLSLVAGQFRNQQLSGKQLPNAPDWSGSVSASYDFAVNESWRVDLGGGLRFVDSYNPAGDFSPGSFQKEAVYWDARARLYSEDDRWDLALIARNLSNELRGLAVFGNTGTGTASGRATGTPADLLFIVNRPWEVRLQLTYRPDFLNP